MKLYPLAVVFAIVLTGGQALADSLDIRIVILRKDRVEAPPKPFSDVGGVSLRQQSTSYEKASCPNTSDTKGQLTCRVECVRKDGALRLYLRGPDTSAWPAVRGYSQPADIPLQIDNCAVAGSQPFTLVYKSAAVMLSELRANNPTLISALLVEPGSWDGKTPLKFKPFGQSVLVLQEYSDLPQGRDALAQLAEFSEAYSLLAKDAKDESSAKTFEEYLFGSRSINLKAAAADSLGKTESDLVLVSPKKSDLLKSAASVEKKLGSKQSLTERDFLLLKEVNGIKQNQMFLANRPDGRGG